MAFSISYVYQAVDRFSRVARNVVRRSADVSRGMQNMGRRAAAAGRQMTQMARQVARAGAAAAKSTEKMRKFGSDAIGKVTLPLAALGTGALVASAKIETLQTSFESITGSAESARKMVEDLVSFTARTPFQLPGVGESAKVLLNFGVEQEKLLSTMGMLGDIAAGTDKPLNEIAQIFGKVKAKNKLMTEELLQFTERGIPVIDMLASRFNVTKAVIFDVASKGALSFEMLQDAMKGMTSEGGIFFDQMSKQSRTLAGRWSTLMDSIIMLAAVIGDVLVEVFGLKGGLAGLADGIVAVANRIKTFAAAHPVMTRILAVFVAVVAALPPLIVLIAGVATAFKILAAVLAVLNVSTGVLGIFVVAVAAVVAAGVALYRNWDKIVSWFEEKFRPIWDGSIFKPFTDGLARMMDAVGSAVSWLVENNPFSGWLDRFNQMVDKVSNFDISAILPDFVAGVFSDDPTPGAMARPAAMRRSQRGYAISAGLSQSDVNIRLSDPGRVVRGTEVRRRGIVPGNTGLAFAD